MPDANPFRWDLTRRDQLGALVESTPPPECEELLEPLLRCGARTLALAGDADLAFVGRSPESLFDLLSGLLFDSSSFQRLSLLHFSMRRISAAEVDARRPDALPALRDYLHRLALDPAGIASRERALTWVDWVDTGGTFGRLVNLLHAWSGEAGPGWNAVRRRLRFVGITERTHNSPNTWRWSQHAAWVDMLPRGAVKSVSMDPGWWHYFAQMQPKVSPSHTADRWAAEDIDKPDHTPARLEALRIAHGLFQIGCTKGARRRFAALLVREPAMADSGFRGLASELRG
jgi:hypothetical protein